MTIRWPILVDKNKSTSQDGFRQHAQIIYAVAVCYTIAESVHILYAISLHYYLALTVKTLVINCLYHIICGWFCNGKLLTSQHTPLLITIICLLKNSIDSPILTMLNNSHINILGNELADKAAKKATDFFFFFFLDCLLIQKSLILQ